MKLCTFTTSRSIRVLGGAALVAILASGCPSSPPRPDEYRALASAPHDPPPGDAR